MKLILSLLMGAEYSLLNGLLKAIENGIVIVAGILCHLMFASKCEWSSFK